MKRALLVGILAGYVMLAQSPQLLVLEKEAASLAFLDPQSGKVLGRVSVGEGPHEIVASSDGKLAFVANYGSRTPGTTISVIDVAARKELRRVDLGPLRRPHGLAYSDGKVYFTAEVNKVIGRYDPASDRVDWILGSGQNSTHMIMVNPDASAMYTANIGSDTITVVERASGPAAWNETVIPVGKGPEGFDISPDRKQLWAAGSRDGSVTIVDLSAKRVASTFDVHTKRSNRLKFTPDGKRVLITDLDAGELVILDAGSRNELKRIKLGRAPEGVLMLPDGSKAFVAVSGDNNIAVFDLGSLEVTGHIPTGPGPDGMAWIAAK